MTTDEAVQTLKYMVEAATDAVLGDVLRDVLTDQEVSALTLAISALERDTPMRLRITTSTKRCPSCNKQVSGTGNIHGNYRFCRWCGQALDWTEPPKEET